MLVYPGVSPAHGFQECLVGNGGPKAPQLGTFPILMIKIHQNTMLIHTHEYNNGIVI